MHQPAPPAPCVQWFGKGDLPLKDVLLNQVYAHLERAYRHIGGITLGSGFADPGEMLRQIPVWRLVFETGRLVSVMVFKETKGRLKMVAYAAGDASEAVKQNDLRCMVRLSHAELSGALLIAVLKQFGPSIQRHLLHADKVLEGRETFTLGESADALRCPENSRTLARLTAEFPGVLPFLYVRRIGGRLKLKLLVGTFRRVDALLAAGRVLAQTRDFLKQFKPEAPAGLAQLWAGCGWGLRLRRSGA